MPLRLGFCLGVLLLCSLLLLLVDNADALRGAIELECRDRHFLISVDQKITSKPLRIEAIDATGVYPLDEKNAGTCGYTYSAFNMEGYIALRASYYSCHTENQNDEIFSFEFNIISTDHLGREAVHHVAKTCYLPLPWSDREVICEENYMEVTVRRDCTVNGPPPKTAWDSTPDFKETSMVSGWLVMFLEDGQEVTMSVGDARALGYGVDATADRVVFRTAYLQPHTKLVKVNDISVVEIHATMFFRQNWMLKMMEFIAACTINRGAFDADTQRVFWEIPTVMVPLVYDHSQFVSKQVSVGVEGQLLDENTRNARGYLLDFRGPMTYLSVPFGADGGYRRSLVLNNTYNEFYTIYLYYEHLFMEGAHETRHRMARACSSPKLPQYPFTIDQTILEEFVFTVYLGNFPLDVELIAVRLNAETFSVSEAFQSGYTISKIPHPNGTHAYIIKVPFEDRLVPRMYLGEGLLQYSLDINYTLNIMPQQDPYYHLASVVALLKDAFPPDIQAVCTEKSIIFKMAHQNLGHVWEVTIGDYQLTPQLAERRGYILQNDSQSLTLVVPVFTIGYTYEEITLNHFFGTFEVLIRDAKTLDIHKSTAKRCLFNTDELIVCSTDGVMTVVAKIDAAIPPVEQSRITLLDKNCKPWQSDTTRVLFAFGVNTCGTRYLVDDQYIVYENEITSHPEFEPEGVPKITRDAEFRLTVQCLYKVNSINRLFVGKMFKSETPGFGSIKAEGSSPKEYGKDYASTPIHSDTSSHISTSYTVSHSGRGVHQSGRLPNGYSASRVHIANGVGPTPSNYGAAGIQNTPGPYVTEGSRIPQQVSSHYRAPQTGTIQHEPSSIHSPSTSSPYSTDQSRRQPHRISASAVHMTNVVPSTQSASNNVQPTQSSYGAVVQNVPDHYGTSEGSSTTYVTSSYMTPQTQTTQYVSGHYNAHHTGTPQPEHSSIHSPSTSSPYSINQSRGHNRYSASRVHMANVVSSSQEGSSTQQSPSGIQPTLSSYGAVGVQNVPGHYGTSEGSKFAPHVSNSYRTPHTGTIQQGSNTFYSTSTSSPYGIDQSRRNPNRQSASKVQFTNVVPSTQSTTNNVQPTLSSYGAVGVQNVPGHSGTREGSSFAPHVSGHYSFPRTGTTQHEYSRIHSPSTLSPYSIDQSRRHPSRYSASAVHMTSVVPSTQSAPNYVQPTQSSYGALDVQNVPGHYGTREGNNTTNVSSGYRTPHTGSTQHGLGNIPSSSNSSPYSIDQSKRHPSRYLASVVHMTNVVPSTQSTSNYVQPTPGSYGAVGVQQVPDHYDTSEGSSTIHLASGNKTPPTGTTQHVSGHFSALNTGTPQLESSSIHSPSTSSPYSIDQSRRHPSRYSASRVHMTNVFPSNQEGSSTQQAPNGIQPTLSSYGAVGIQNVLGHNEASMGSSQTQHVSNHYIAPHTGTTQYGLGSIHSTSSPYGADQSRSNLNIQTSASASRVGVTNVVSNTLDRSRTGHFPSISYGGGSASVPRHDGDSSIFQHGSIQHAFGNDRSVPTTYGLHQSSSPLGSKERPQDSRYYSNGGILAASSEPSKVSCTSKSSKDGPSKFIHVQRDSHHSDRTHAHRGIKRGNGAT